MQNFSRKAKAAASEQERLLQPAGAGDEEQAGTSGNGRSPLRRSLLSSTSHQSHHSQQQHPQQPPSTQTPSQRHSRHPPQQIIDNRPRPSKQPNRTTKTSQKLVVFPDSVPPETHVTDLDSQYGGDDTAHAAADPREDDRVRSYPMRVAKVKEMERLQRMDRQDLPRVTAYCTAQSYHMDALFAFLLSRRDSNGCEPERVDECLHTRFTPPVSIFHLRTPSGGGGGSRGDVTGSSPAKAQATLASDAGVGDDDYPLPSYGELFFFDYGVVVIWGLTEPQEHYVLSILQPFEEEKLEPDDVETEPFHFQYRSLSQPRIFNDVITLRAPLTKSQVIGSGLDDDGVLRQDSMMKLTISHAIAQSTKLTRYEQRIDDTILTTQHIPLIMARTGKVPMSRTAITKKIGQLFVMRINVNLVSPILDTPELFWSEPSLEPLYTAVRGYLEISQRVELLNQRCSVISDLLDMLKEHLNSAHGETLEWIIIILIAIEIVIGIVEIFFDFFEYYRKP